MFALLTLHLSRQMPFSLNHVRLWWNVNLDEDESSKEGAADGCLTLSSQTGLFCPCHLVRLSALSHTQLLHKYHTFLNFYHRRLAYKTFATGRSINNVSILLLLKWIWCSRSWFWQTEVTLNLKYKNCSPDNFTNSVMQKKQKYINPALEFNHVDSLKNHQGQVFQFKEPH